jgi:hypothetical protein
MALPKTASILLGCYCLLNSKWLPTFLRLLNLKVKPCALPKRQKIFTSQHGVISEKNLLFIYCPDDRLMNNVQFGNGVGKNVIVFF